MTDQADLKPNWIGSILELFNFILEIATIVELAVELVNESDNMSW